jgi:hypothetical protein
MNIHNVSVKADVNDPIMCTGGSDYHQKSSGFSARKFILPHAHKLLLVACILGIAPLPSITRAAESTNTVAAALSPASLLWSMSVHWENDTFGGTDRYYTDGVSLSLAHTGPNWMDPVFNILPWGEGRRTVGYDVTQLMITPADTTRAIPDPNDRPYAGLLEVGLSLHVEHDHSYHGLKFITGVIGPAALAAETQREVHQIGGWGDPQGWDYQLKNEPIMNLAYEYRYRFELVGHRDGWSMEALPIAGAWLGNDLTQGEIGALMRFGYHMPDDFGTTLVRGMGHLPPPRRDGDSSDWGFSIYGGVLGNLVLRDITLDGNSFQDSPNVAKKHFVPVAGAGMSVGNRHFQAAFTYVFWGKEFQNQDEHSQFGSITLMYIF